MPTECECDWSLMPPKYDMTNIRIFNHKCLQCSGYVSKKKYSGAIYITEEAGIQGRTIDAIFCEGDSGSWYNGKA